MTLQATVKAAFARFRLIKESEEDDRGGVATVHRCLPSNNLMESFEGGRSRKRIRSMEGREGAGMRQSLGNLGNDERLIFHGEVR